MRQNDNDDDGPFPKGAFPTSVFPRRIFPWMGGDDDEDAEDESKADVPEPESPK